MMASLTPSEAPKAPEVKIYQVGKCYKIDVKEEKNGAPEDFHSAALNYTHINVIQKAKVGPHLDSLFCPLTPLPP
jgi:hypothetical protein